MRTRIIGVGLAALLVTSLAVAQSLKSGPQVGQSRPGAFHPLNVFNVDQPSRNGQKNCFV
ncbi:MAG: hypothetical protein RMI91_03305 [Gemmatales bacterium]|nr:hypothetical protein [Gemmatales bacterium]MDW7993658.1 hypothetical protein [Gemmatales bacterium]